MDILHLWFLLTISAVQYVSPTAVLVVLRDFQVGEPNVFCNLQDPPRPMLHEEIHFSKNLLESGKLDELDNY